MTGQPLSAAEVTKVTGGRASTGVNGNRKGHEVEAGQIRGTPFAPIVSTSQRVDAGGGTAATTGTGKLTNWHC